MKDDAVGYFDFVEGQFRFGVPLVGDTHSRIPPEAICAKCGEPIRWCLDMFTFTSGFEEPRFALAHARCVWEDTAFYEQARHAPTDGDGE